MNGISNTVTRVGGKEAGKFYPEIGIDKWNAASVIDMRLEESLAGSSHVIDGTVDKFIKTDLECHLYAYLDGYEFAVLFKKRPPKDYLQFSISTKLCTLWYQPELTPSEKNSGIIRPDDIINSIAIYSPFKHNEYQTGKVAHIKRGKAIDFNGVEEWCDWTVESSSEVRLWIPPAYLNAATYPILIDPTFGYTTAGGTALTAKKKVWASSGTSGGTAGTGNSIKAYLDGSGGARSICGLYSDSSGPSALVSNSQTGTQTPTSAAWYTHTFGTAPTIGASTTYWAAIGGENIGSINCYYDSAADAYLHNNYDAVASGMSSTYSKDTYYGSRIISIYCDYTESGGGGYVDLTNIIMRSILTDV